MKYGLIVKSEATLRAGRPVHSRLVVGGLQLLQRHPNLKLSADHGSLSQAQRCVWKAHPLSRHHRRTAQYMSPVDAISTYLFGIKTASRILLKEHLGRSIRDGLVNQLTG